MSASKPATSGYGRSTAVLSVGIGATGLVTYAYFALSSHLLSAAEYGGITLLWSAVFIVVSVLYRPVEQLISRATAERSVRGQAGSGHLRVAATLQLSLCLAFAGAALGFREPIEGSLFEGSSTLYWVLVVTVPAYAVSYFARGFIAGSQRFGLYGGLVLMEASARCLFALAVAVGIVSGQAAIALGIAAAPILSLLFAGLALHVRSRRTLATYSARQRAGIVAPHPESVGEPRFTLGRGGGFAAGVLVVMLAEQTFLNAGPLLVRATEEDAGAALAGFAFNALLVARVPLQLFQAVQTPILPFLTRLRASDDPRSFRRGVTVTVAAIAVFAATVALAMLAFGPWLMSLLFGGSFNYGRGGLALVAVGMGFYLAAATLNQAALARERTREAATCWVASASVFVGLLLAPGVSDPVLRLEVAYAAGSLILCALLYGLYRREDG